MSVTVYDETHDDAPKFVLVQCNQIINAGRISSVFLL